MNIQIHSWSEKIASILQDIQSWSCPCSPLDSGGLVLCSAWHVRCNSASFKHLQLMWTTLHPSNLCKNSFYDCAGVKSQNNEIWKSWSWPGNLNKTVVRIRSGLFKMCWILPDSRPEIRILYTSGGDHFEAKKDIGKMLHFIWFHMDSNL